MNVSGLAKGNGKPLVLDNILFSDNMSKVTTQLKKEMKRTLNIQEALNLALVKISLKITLYYSVNMLIPTPLSSPQPPPYVLNFLYC